MNKLKILRNPYTALIIAVIALLVSVVANSIAFHNYDSLTSQGQSNRTLIGKTELEQCTKIYGEFVAQQEKIVAQDTPKYVKYELKLLGLSYSAAKVNTIIKVGKASAAAQERSFNPAQCNSLPTVKEFLGK